MPNPIQLIHITPELPPTIGGVSDYTSILTKRLIEESDGSVQPSMILAGWKKSNEKPNVDLPIVDLGGECSADRLANTIRKLASKSGNRTIVLLQYSGYGYAKRGAPLWLLRGLKKVCSEDVISLVTMFHELYAIGKHWTSTFWMTPLQKYVAAQLAKLSRAIVTNRDQSAKWLQNYISNGISLKVQPVFSNVGEPESVPLFEDREPYAVVFGGRGMKHRLYGSWDENIDHFLRQAGVEKIIDIGSSNPSLYEHLSWPVEAVGIQPASAISGYMKYGKAGLILMPLHCLTKSGVFSAYAAHGLVVGVTGEPGDASPLSVDRHFINVDGSNQTTTANVKGISTRAFEWYEKDAHSRQMVKTIQSFIDSFK